MQRSNRFLCKVYGRRWCGINFSWPCAAGEPFGVAAPSSDRSETVLLASRSSWVGSQVAVIAGVVKTIACSHWVMGAMLAIEQGAKQGFAV